MMAPPPCSAKMSPTTATCSATLALEPFSSTKSVGATASDIPEATRFWPERWLQATPEPQRFESARSIPFGSGPRICPGRSLALLEMRLVLGMVYRHFEVERTIAAAAVHERFAFSMTPTRLPARVQLRAALMA